MNWKPIQYTQDLEHVGWKQTYFDSVEYFDTSLEILPAV